MSVTSIFQPVAKGWSATAKFAKDHYKGPAIALACAGGLAGTLTGVHYGVRLVMDGCEKVFASAKLPSEGGNYNPEP